MMQAHEIKVQVAQGFTRHPASAPPPSAANLLQVLLYMRRVALAGTLPGG